MIHTNYVTIRIMYIFGYWPRIINIMNILTKEEYEKFKQELKHLYKVERPKVAQDLKEAIAQGDLSENAAYADAKERQSEIETKIKELEKKMAMSEIVERAEGGEVVKIGISFRVRDIESGQERQFTIVGSRESSPALGKISFDSPLGSAFMEKKAGDEVEILTPGGKKKYAVIEIL